MTNIEDNIYIFGSPRSGTTWLGEVLSSAGIELNFEPESNHPKNLIGVNNDFPLNYFPLEEDSRWNELLTKQAKGEIVTDWTQRGNQFTSERKIIKYIRGTFFLPWLLHEGARYLVWIHRSPFESILSMKRTGWFDSEEYKKIISEPRLVEKYFSPYKNLWEGKSLSWTEARILQWCLEYTYMHSYKDKLLTVSYEVLRHNPQMEMKVICTYCNVDFSKIPEEMFRKKSSTTVDYTVANRKGIIGNEIQLTTEDVSTISRYLDLFGIPYEPYNIDKNV